MIKEQSFVTDYLDENGLREGDEIKVSPASGKKYQFQLNRTCFDLVSDSLFEKVSSMSKKRLVGMNKEDLHIQVKVQKVSGRNKVICDRYFLKVLEGGAVKLNGSYVFEAILERGDVCEVGFNTIHFESAKIKEADNTNEFYIQKYQKVIKSNLPILLQGETGVGKTTLARRIHENSNATGEFIHLNIASYSPSLIESELFGHVKGAFTGAINDKRGAFRQAQHGTLFIDEIDSLPMDLQTKLLIFLDEFKARAVGDSKEYEVSTRLIFSSGRNLSTLVESKVMRADFYFRLSSGQVLKMKSLRDDPKRIIQFCEEFEMKQNVFLDKKLKEFYSTLPWPGNYRQLNGHLTQKKILSSSRKFNFDELDRKLIEQSSYLGDIHESIISLKEVKTAYAKRAFMQCNQNYTIAAQKLCISSRSLRNMLQEEYSL